MSPLDTTTAEFLDERGWSRKTPLPREQVLQWLASDDLKVLAATFDLLENKNGFARVQPPLTPKEKRIHLCRFFEHALPHAANTFARVQSEEDNDEDIDDYGWPFNISHSLAYWIADFLRDEATTSSEREIMLAWVRGLVLQNQFGSSLTTAILDHLVWNRATRRYFKSWHTDPELAFLF